MKLVTVALLLSFAACLAACAVRPPSAIGVSLYEQGDVSGAFDELDPLARRGDPVAQYFIARMALEGAADAHNDLDEAARLLVSSAKGEETRAYALLLLLRMPSEDRLAFFAASEPGVRPLRLLADGSGALGAASADKSAFEELRAAAEAVAGGPVSQSLLMLMIDHAAFIKKWPTSSFAVAISNEQLLSIDEALSARNDKYAKMRLANRYADGNGVEQDRVKAFELRMSAAKFTPPPRNCVYQAPVAGGSGSTYCYDAGEARPGLPRAMLEVCRAYATGDGVAKDVGKAREWCERAAKASDARKEALEVLDQFTW